MQHTSSKHKLKETVEIKNNCFTVNKNNAKNTEKCITRNEIYKYLTKSKCETAKSKKNCIKSPFVKPCQVKHKQKKFVFGVRVLEIESSKIKIETIIFFPQFVFIFLKSLQYKNENRREFQRGLDCQVGKQKRHEERLTLRKQIREGYLNKRRKALTGDTEPIKGIGPTATKESSGDRNRADSLVPSWVSMENLEKFAQQLKSNNFDQVFEAVQAIRQMLSIEEKPPIEQVFKVGVVPDLLNILKEKIEVADPRHKTLEEEKKCKLQFEAAWYFPKKKKKKKNLNPTLKKN
ncbi:importin alpha [Reticulomyxa filosa]|uniref:Importin alpha n=1 Tax=Reticulomyxa filosa TaxID=46433 RepID=X6LGH0_RETFI|nr:importin alpha [Reticulomyxa filosa]|eukprot:ETO00684.1 importin alpha [Reticulomyxa filosa]